MGPSPDRGGAPIRRRLEGASALLAPLLAAALAAQAAPAKAPWVFEGAAGSAQIVLWYSEDADGLTGDYFYKSTRLDIAVAGKRRGAALELASEVTGDKLELKPQGDRLVGVLTTAKGKRLDVALRPAAQPLALPPDAPTGLDLYEKKRLEGLSLSPQAAEVRNGRTLRWYREPLTGLRLFRLEAGYAPEAMAAINHALGRRQWGKVADYLQCTTAEGRPGVEGAKADAPWLGATVVSYRWRQSWDCAGAAHPDAGIDSQSFDALTGRELKLDEVLPAGRGPPPKENAPGWLEYRGSVFAPAVVALMRRHHPQEMKPPKGEDDCNYADPEVWSFPSWALTDKGLWLGPSFARVARVCDNPDWSVLPLSALPAATAVRR